MLSSSLVLLASFFLTSSNQDGGATPPPAAPASPAVPASPEKPSLEVTVPTLPNTSCPIMGKPVSSKLYTDTDRGRIYVCCKSCIPKIRADLEPAYRSAYPTTKKAGNTKCPVTGDPVEGSSVTVELQGYEIALCCQDCVAAATENAQIVLARALEPDLVDLENEACPVTGEAVAKNTFAIVSDTLIRLSSADCIEKVREDPSGVLEKAKSLRKDAPAKDDAKPKSSSEGGGR